MIDKSGDDLLEPPQRVNELTYKSMLHRWEKLRQEALYITEEALKSSNVRIHSVTSRIKSFDSFAAKVVRKSLKDPLNEIRDVVGLRIVCLFISDIDRIGDLIRSEFELLEQDNKIDGGEVSSFGYMSFHFIVQMKSSYTGPRYIGIGNLPFEIQVRTIAMDAWAATSHYLDYKSETDVPSDLRRDFYALSGLFYVADRHFEMFFNSKQAAIEEITQTLRNPLDLDHELNLDSLTAYLGSRFADREQSGGPDASELLSELRSAGVNTVKALAGLVDAGIDWLEADELRNPPLDWDSDDPPLEDLDKVGTTRYTAVGVVRSILKREN